MKQRFIIQIGLPKTGTTSIQEYFHSNRKNNRDHLIYPTIGLATNTNQETAHHNIARFFSAAPRVRARYTPSCGSPDDLTQELSSNPPDVPVLLSSEGFWGLMLIDRSTNKFCEYIESLREKFDVSILLTWRNSLDYKQSTYFHNAKRRPPITYPFTNGAVREMDDIFWKAVDVLSNAANHVYVVKYSGDIVENYINLMDSAFGIKLVEYDGGIRTNPSFNTAQKIFALACSWNPDLVGPKEYRKTIEKLADTDISGAMKLTLGPQFEALRQQSDARFQEQISHDNVTIVA